MRDHFVRIAFHEKVLKKAHACQDTIVINELGLKNGANRADIVVLNGKMIGYEIKTDNDTLGRFLGQMVAYNEVFDQVWVITGGKHLDKIIQYTPEWWGVYLICETKDGGYAFKAIRKAKKNKRKDRYSIARLLWKEEAIDILAGNDQSPKNGMTRHDLYHLISEQYSANKLTKITLKYLKNRVGWRTNQKALL
jgi:hypothetical protein